MMNTEELTEYLQYVKMLEVRLYEQKQICDKLSDKVYSLKNKKYEEPEKLLQTDSDGSLFMAVLYLGGIGAFIGLFVGLFNGISHESGFILFRLFNCKTKYIGEGILWGGIIGIIIGIIMYIYFAIDTKITNKEIVRDNIQITKKAKAMKERDRVKIKIIEKEINNISYQYNETKSFLNKAYQLKVLHPKYQNIIAVCSLYEYLVTGRCTQLVGHEGAYNIFEMEKRMDLIILKLDEVIDKLDGIREYQHELYSALSTSNKNIDKICKQVSVVSEQLGNIEQNQTLIEYNSSVTASNTEFLKWLSYFRG